MFFSFFTALSVVASLGHAYPGKLQSRDVPASELNQFNLWAQYAAATYYEKDYTAKLGNKLCCSKGNCPKVEEIGATVSYDFSDSTITDTTGFVAVDHTNSAVVLAFRGSVSVRNWISDAILNPDYELVVVGHSLGAAAAALTVADLRGKGYPSAKLYAFASPRVANAALAKYITAQGNNFRFTHTNDPIPKLPLLSMGYVHVSPEYWITSPNNSTVSTSEIKVIDGDVSFDGNNRTVLARYATAQFVPAPSDLITKKGHAGINVRYKEVPAGICEQDPSVKSYSGYADVGKDEHIFWWFFEARNGDPKDAPLTVWINGGPGSSSMLGLFQELGPCGVDHDGNVFNNPHSWSNVSNMLFVDQPATVGLSYTSPIPAYQDSDGNIVQLPSEECPDYAQGLGTCGTYSKPDIALVPNTTANVAPNMWKTLQGFMGAFPQYSRNGFNFATESYGGHYGPVFNEYFVKQNAKKAHGSIRIDLENVLIGNGWFDPLIQYQAYYNFSIFPGNTYDFNPYNESVQAEWYNNLYGEGNCVDQTLECYATGRNDICSAADNFCASKVESLYDTYSGRDEYDMRELTPDPFPYEFYVDYLNSPKVQAAIGAYQNFSESSGTVSNAFGSTGDDDRESGTIESVKKLLEAGVQVLLYFGDADFNCNWLGGQVIAEEINARGYEHAGFVNITTSDGVVHGQVRQSDLFSFVRIYESGHEVPFYQPLAALEMFERVVTRKDIATGKKHMKPHGGYRTHGTPTSEYREGNSTVVLEVLDSDATYNTTLNGPNPSSSASIRLRRSGH
ncbi:Lipase, class 3 [Penicillium italicum]|uniref:Lipase, class 3 n=1 Tax=Penicillium italicum TaxID=40296 RepID=A0A0A2LC00_PENIT|nr:Lipase, class 3 [Penicillium italicum]